MIINGNFNQQQFSYKILGKFTFDKLTVYGKIEETYFLIIFSDLFPYCDTDLNSTLQNEKINQNSYFYSFPIILQNCETGQVLRSFKNL